MSAAWRWWRARSRRAKAVILAAAAVLLLLGLPVGQQAEPEQAAAEAAEQQPSTVSLPPAETEQEAPASEVEAPAEPIEVEAEPETAPAAEPSGDLVAVTRVVDGDTITLASGTTVRLVQIDTPELRGSECYAEEATATLNRLLPLGTKVRSITDPSLDQVDRYGRQLAYIFKGRENINVTLVAEGAASVWFYQGARGRYADEFLAAAERAQREGRGLWGACEATLNPLAAVATAARGGTTPVPSAPAAASSDGDGCHPAYDPCLPIVADMNCPAVRALGKAPVRVKQRGVDPYRLDGDRDGVGCQ
jgi:micrococcal nuclease